MISRLGLIIFIAGNTIFILITLALPTATPTSYLITALVLLITGGAFYVVSDEEN